MLDNLNNWLEKTKQYHKDWINAQSGLGLIVIYWIFLISFLAGLALICLGIIYTSGWIFLTGLLCIRLLIYMFQISDSFWRKIN